MSDYGTITIGRLSLCEAIEPTTINDNADLKITGQDGSPITTDDIAQRLTLDITALPKYVAITHTDKTIYDGWYEITGAEAAMTHNRQPPIVVDWSIDARRIGSLTAVELESRLSGAVSRQNNYSTTGERIHCPGVGVSAYNSTSTTSTVQRVGEDGALVVYRGLSAGIYPRWMATNLFAVMAGRVKIAHVDGYEYAGTHGYIPPASWVMSNSLVKISPSGDALNIDSYDGSAWRSDTVKITRNGSSLGSLIGATILRNDLECCIVRGVYTYSTGRAQVDIILRRGSRLCEITIKTTNTATLAVTRTSAAAGTVTGGYVSQSANNANGHRYMIGSAKTHTSDTTNGGVALASATQLDACYGLVVAGSSATAGDTASDLYAQYIGACSETVRPIR